MTTCLVRTAENMSEPFKDKKNLKLLHEMSPEEFCEWAATANLADRKYASELLRHATDTLKETSNMETMWESVQEFSEVKTYLQMFTLKCV